GIVKGAQAVAVPARQAFDRDLQPFDHGRHFVERRLINFHVMSGDALNGAGEIVDEDRGLVAIALEEEAEPLLEGVELGEIGDALEACSSMAPMHEGRCESSKLTLPVGKRLRAHGAKWKILKEVAAAEPIEISIDIRLERCRESGPGKRV